jgi:glycosyltransferase involved in cell wall biosynthesis
MKIAFVNQPADRIIPPIQSSIGACTHGISRPLAQECSVIVYGSTVRAHQDLGRDYYQDGVHFRFFPSTRYEKLLFKLWWRYARLVQLLNRGMKPPISTSSWIYPDFGKQVAADLSQQDCDVIHIQHCSQYLPTIRALNPNAKIVLHLHAEWFPQSNFKMLAERLQHVDLVTTVSDHITERTRRNFPQIADRCETIYNGIESSDFTREKDYKQSRNQLVKRILYAGAVSPHKGVHVLLEAFELVVQQYPQVHLDIAGPLGSYPMEECFDLSDPTIVNSIAPFYVKNYAAALRKNLSAATDNKVSFLGLVPHSDLPDYYYNTDIFVFPPVWNEGFGLPPVEAMAAGVPVVASKAGAIVETVVDGETGILVEKNDPFALAQAILRLLEDDSLRETMGRAGRRRALQQFTWDKIARTTLERYYRLCEDKRSKLPLAKV